MLISRIQKAVVDSYPLLS